MPTFVRRIALCDNPQNSRTIADSISRPVAMSDQTVSNDDLAELGERLPRFRGYLRLLARSHLADNHQAKVDPSDIVQQTLLEAYDQRDRFHGNDDQLAAWLRQILVHNVSDAIRALARQCRDAKRERSLDVAIDDSFIRVHEWLAAEQTSPSAQAIRSEQLLSLADALEALPEAQREAIILHHIHGWTLARTAQHLNRGESAVAGLLHRGLKGLRQSLRNLERGHD
jgi:RNA polymerase sigma-70 factor (ECF subfamily)